MNSWSEGYFTDSTYTFGYYRELSPNFIRWCLTLKGFVTPEVDGGCHCELGIGQGVSANIHAAANPGKFFGTDFNPAHAAHAQELAKASASDAKFFEDSFEEFANRDDLPQFDTISFHGIWSWVSDENRRHMLDIVRKHLKSGGAVYCSYNCLPGWAPVAPMRELLKLHDSYTTGMGVIDERVKAAMNFVEEFIAAKPAYLEIAPAFAERFERLKKHDAHYIAHEYLNLDWDLMYFTDVVNMFREYKLDFATTAAPVESLERLGVSEDAWTFLSKITDPLMREQVRDYFVNRQFRKDLFVRGPRRLSLYESQRRILETRYVLQMPAEDVSLKFATSTVEVNLSEEIYRPLLEFLQEDNFRPKTFIEYLQRHPEKKVPELFEAAIFLVGGNRVMPCQSEATVKRVKKSCERFNAYTCERAKVDETISFLASPLTGCGYNLNRFQQVFLALYKGGERSTDGLVKAVWDMMEQQGQRIILNGEKIEDVDKNLSHLKSAAEKFMSKDLPLFKTLQL